MQKYLKNLCLIYLWALIGPWAVMTSGANAAPPSISAFATLVKGLHSGFYLIPNTSIAKTFPTREQLKGSWGVIGPQAVITAWTGAGFDEARMEWYFQGGGHTDYGGNEVYRFSFSSLSWKRLTQPSPYPKRNPDVTAPIEDRCPYPLEGPPSTHTYDGTFFAPATDTLFVLTNIAYCPSGMRWGNGVYEFNPSETESRNGLAPLAWRWRPEISMPKGLKHSAVLPDGKVLLGGEASDVILDPKSGQVGNNNGDAGNAGQGTSVYDKRRKVIWLLNGSGLSRINYKDNILWGRQKIVSTPLPYGLTSASGIAVHEPSGKLVFWAGAGQVVTFDPESNQWQKFDPPGAGLPHSKSATTYIYSKWIYIPSLDIFAGYNDPQSGILLFKLPL